VTLITRKPVEADDAEIARNPRSRMRQAARRRTAGES
jgi:16S rRNA C1402 N4-methylase RsmH